MSGKSSTPESTGRVLRGSAAGGALIDAPKKRSSRLVSSRAGTRNAERGEGRGGAGGSAKRTASAAAEQMSCSQGGAIESSGVDAECVWKKNRALSE